MKACLTMVVTISTFILAFLCEDAQSKPKDTHDISELPSTYSLEEHINYNNVDPIVVNATRRGEAEIGSDTEFDENDISAYGSDNISDLLNILVPFSDNPDNSQIILINGKPAGFDRSVLSYPAEALERIAVLKPEAAAYYGEAAGKRVINLVLKKNFTMLNADASLDFATAGAQRGGKIGANRTVISGETRWNAQLRFSDDSAFFKTARDIPPRDGVFDSVGFISAPQGGELDPLLSAAAGRIVTSTAIPATALLHQASLDDFAAMAHIAHPANPNRFETLQSARRSASLGIGVTRPIGAFSASLNLNASHNASNGLRGLPMGTFRVSEEHPRSPFSTDIILTRPLAGERALRNENGSTGLNASLSVNGSIGGWQTNLGLNYSLSQSDNLLETGIDIAAAQGLIDSNDPAFNPFGFWDDNLLLANNTQTKSQNISARVNVRKTILELPAGQLSWNFTGDSSWHDTQIKSAGADKNWSEAVSFARRQSGGQMTLSVPIFRREEDRPSPVGDLSADFSLGIQTMAKSQPQKRFGMNVSWSPWRILQLRGSIDVLESSPTFEQLDGPLITSVTRVFDYARQEIAEPIWLTGGNSALKGGRRQTVDLSFMVRPLGDQSLTLNAGFRKSISRGGVATFPALTPAIEDAFPERVIRDAEGQLITIDARAINIERDTDSSLNSSIAFRLGAGVIGSAERKAKGSPLQFSIALKHRMLLKNELLTRTGLSAIDQLQGGGQSRHNLSLQATIGKRGIGANLNGSWSSAARLRGGTSPHDDFIFTPPMTFNLSAFVEPDRLFKLSRKGSIWSKLKFSVDVQNLFNGYRRVTLADGHVPAGYTRDEIDPLGRTMRLSLRKRF